MKMAYLGVVPRVARELLIRSEMNRLLGAALIRLSIQSC